MILIQNQQKLENISDTGFKRNNLTVITDALSQIIGNRIDSFSKIVKC